jgi:hypothetical protein
MPTLYREAGTGLKAPTFHEKRSDKPTEQYVYDPAELIRRASHCGKTSSILLSHVNRAKQGKFKTKQERRDYLT